ncbi:MAG: YdcF family protein [Chthoniobacteraceae bacterium]
MNSRRFLQILGFALLLLVVCLVALVASGLNDHLGQADVALVLGNKIERDGRPSSRLQARLDRTIELYRSGYFPVIIVSGGIGIEGYDEALVMRDYLVSKGIPALAVIMDNKGITTFASAENAREIMRDRGYKSVFVISQYFHIPRSRMALSKLGIAPVYSAYARYFEARDLYSSLREVAGYLRYYCRSNEKSHS